jgi:hypothetical protein
LRPAQPATEPHVIPAKAGIQRLALCPPSFRRTRESRRGAPRGSAPGSPLSRE